MGTGFAKVIDLTKKKRERVKETFYAKLRRNGGSVPGFICCSNKKPNHSIPFSKQYRNTIAPSFLCKTIMN